MEKKYRLDENDTIKFNGHTLYRIIALKSTRRYVEGDMGGYIESEDNLSHEGECWVGCGAWVFGSSEIKDNAFVFGHAIVKDSVVKDTSRVHRSVSLIDSLLEGACDITGENVTIFDSSLTDTYVYDDATIKESEIINSFISDEVTLKKASIEDCSFQGSITVNNTLLRDVELNGDAVINSEWDLIVFQNNFSSNRKFVWTRSNDKWTVGCFYGTGKELIEKAYIDNHLKGRYYEAYVNFIENIKKINDERTREFEQSTKDISLGS